MLLNLEGEKERVIEKEKFLSFRIPLISFWRLKASFQSICVLGHRRPLAF